MIYALPRGNLYHRNLPNKCTVRVLMRGKYARWDAAGIPINASPTQSVQAQENKDTIQSAQVSHVKVRKISAWGSEGQKIMSIGLPLPAFFRK